MDIYLTFNLINKTAKDSEKLSITCITNLKHISSQLWGIYQVI